MNCNYRFCQTNLPNGLNGNRRYCNDQCNYFERLEREKEKNAAKRALIIDLRRIEALLRTCYNWYGESIFDVGVLRSMKMNWTLFSSINVIEGVEFKIVGSYGYRLFNNDTIKIIKF